MRTGPKDAAALSTLEKLLILPRNEGRDQGCSLVVGNGDERDIAIRAPIDSGVVRPQIEFEVLVELPQLAFKVIVCDQGTPATNHFAFRQPSVTSEQPSGFLDGPLNQRLVRNHLLVGRVVPKNAQPACQTAEHRIGYEAYGLLYGSNDHV